MKPDPLMANLNHEIYLTAKLPGLKSTNHVVRLILPHGKPSRGRLSDFKIRRLFNHFYQSMCHGHIGGFEHSTRHVEHVREGSMRSVLEEEDFDAVSHDEGTDTVRRLVWDFDARITSLGAAELQRHVSRTRRLVGSYKVVNIKGK